VALVDEWRKIQTALPADWGDARALLVASSDAEADRTAAVLGPVNAARRGREISFYTARRGGDAAPPGRIERLLARLDEEHVHGTLHLVSTREAEAPPPEAARTTLAGGWDAALANLPADWSDVHAEVELTSSDYLDRAALLLAPVNPARAEVIGFRFRCARLFGYGASPGMTRRCLERLDEETITGTVRILRVLSETQPVATQGPVWMVAGKAV
jgi:hypothetical protein